MLIYCVYSKKALKLIFLNSLTGVTALFILKAAESLISVNININIISFILSAVLGVPGLGQYLLIEFLFL